jgi:hypothetical protein
MKNHFPLSPPLEHIERRLFGVSEGIIEAVIRGETSPGVAETVRLSPEWSQYHIDLQEEKIQINSLSTEQHAAFTMPEYIQSMVRHRVAAQSLNLLTSIAPGQIVSVEKIVTPRAGQLDAIMMAPLYVLLDAQAETPSVWHGWLVSAETDYAGWWDFVLQEQDAPFDPEAAMVQVWNPVRVYLPMAGRVKAQLSMARLQAVRSLAGDFITNDPPVDVPSWPGRVASRTTSAGLRVVTGSPLESDGDARQHYQQLYFKAAEAVREPARLALRALAEVPATQIGELLKRLIAAAGKASQYLLPQPHVAIAMSGDESSNDTDLLWPDIARLQILALMADGAGQMKVTSIGTEAFTVEVLKGSELEEHVKIDVGGSETITWDEGSTQLRFITTSGKRLELSLKDLE